jgi:hypothetical protein
MQPVLKIARPGLAILAVLILAAAGSPDISAFAQATPAQAQTSTVSGTTVRALQEALTKQGIAVKVDGVLNDETRAAIRRYQSQHHLPVTGEPDKATLDKLGVVGGQTSTPASPQSASEAPATASQGQSQSGMMMGGGMMQGQGMGPGPMAGQTQSGQTTQSGTTMNCPMMQGRGMGSGMMMHCPMTPSGGMGAGMMMNCPMMQGPMQEMMQMMQRMQMMQGMMMQMMQGMMMQPGQMQPGTR